MYYGCCASNSCDCTSPLCPAKPTLDALGRPARPTESVGRPLRAHTSYSRVAASDRISGPTYIEIFWRPSCYSVYIEAKSTNEWQERRSGSGTIMCKNQSSSFITSKITKLIASASDEVLRDISRYDNHGGGGVTYEQACDMHFDGLKDMISKHNCRAVWSEHYWYPMEAVELRAFVPDNGSSLSFAVAILILLLDDIEDGGRDHMEARSSERYLKSYQALSPEFSKLIFDGLNILKEADA